MWIELPTAWIVVLNVVGIPVAHLAVSWWSARLPKMIFDFNASSTFRKPNRIYENFFHVRHWKHLLPDAAPWFRGFAKASLQSADPQYLRKFILETRRGEFSHWLQLVVICLFIIWNPVPANMIIVVYALFANLPCIINLRYTRERMRYILGKTQSKPVQAS